jgi:toxin ParE1/3/4
VKLRWSNEALDELATITDFVAQFPPAYADELATRIAGAADRLLAFPEMGRKNTAIDSPHVRELLVEKYRLVYYVDSQLITIMAVRHQAQRR